MASYPNSIYKPRTRANRSGVVYNASKQTVWFKEDADAIENEIIAVESTLKPNAGALELWLPGAESPSVIFDSGTP